MKTIVAAIDPGASGGMAVSFPDAPDKIDCTPMSTNSEGELCDELKELQATAQMEEYRFTVYIERVTGFIGGINRGSHMFAFGRSYEYAFGLCHALKIQIIKVEPAAWQAYFDCPKKLSYKDRKKWAVLEAKSRLPYAQRIIADTADAALLCSYGRSLSG